MNHAKSKNKVVAAGHICLDISPVFPESYWGKIDELFVPGKLINVEAAQIHIGGSVANTGLAMALFGADVRLMGKVGNDEFGTIISRLVKSHGISEGLIVSDSSRTSYTIVLALPGRDRIFLHDPGANDTFVFDDLDMEAVRQARLFHFGYPPLMKYMYLDGGREMKRMFEAVSEAGVVTSLDLAAVDPQSPAGRADWENILAGTLPHVDIFAPSVEELLFMLEREKFDRLVKTAGGRDLTALVNLERDIRPLAEKAARMGAGIVLIKCGEPGLYFKTAGREKIGEIENKLGAALDGWADQEGFEKSYAPERVVSATGAGDVTIAAFLTAFLEANPLPTCLQYAAASGACCVEAYDSLSGLKPFEELRKKINAGWKKVQPVEKD